MRVTAFVVCSHALVGRDPRAAPALTELAEELRLPQPEDLHLDGCDCLGCALIKCRPEAHHERGVLEALGAVKGLDNVVLVATDTNSPMDGIKLAELIKAYESCQPDEHKGLVCLPAVSIVRVDEFHIDKFRTAVRDELNKHTPSGGHEFVVAQVGATQAICGIVLGMLDAGLRPRILDLHTGRNEHAPVREIGAEADGVRVLMRVGAWGRAAARLQSPTQRAALTAMHHAVNFRWQQIDVRELPGVHPAEPQQNESMVHWLWSITAYKLMAGDARAALAFRIWAEAWLSGFADTLPPNEVRNGRDLVELGKLRRSRHWNCQTYPGLVEFKELQRAINAASNIVHGGEATVQRLGAIHEALLARQCSSADPFTAALKVAQLSPWSLKRPDGALIVLAIGTRAGMADAVVAAVENIDSEPSWCRGVIVLHTDDDVSRTGGKKVVDALESRMAARCAEVSLTDLAATMTAVEQEVSRALRSGHAQGSYARVLGVVGGGSAAMNLGLTLGCAQAAAQETTPFAVAGLRDANGASRGSVIDQVGEGVPARLVADAVVRDALPALLDELDLDTALRVLDMASRRWDDIRRGVENLRRALYEPTVSCKCLRGVVGGPVPQGGDIAQRLLLARVGLLRRLAQRDPWRCTVEIARVIDKSVPDEDRGNMTPVVALFDHRNRCLHPTGDGNDLPAPETLEALIRKVRKSLRTWLGDNQVTPFCDRLLCGRLDDLKSAAADVDTVG